MHMRHCLNASSQSSAIVKTVNSMLVVYIHLKLLSETSEILPLSTVFFQPVELVTTCTLTMLGALEVVRAAYCAL